MMGILKNFKNKNLNELKDTESPCKIHQVF